MQETAKTIQREKARLSGTDGDRTRLGVLFLDVTRFVLFRSVRVLLHQMRLTSSKPLNNCTIVIDESFHSELMRNSEIYQMFQPGNQFPRSDVHVLLYGRPFFRSWSTRASTAVRSVTTVAKGVDRTSSIRRSAQSLLQPCTYAHEEESRDNDRYSSSAGPSAVELQLYEACVLYPTIE